MTEAQEYRYINDYLYFVVRPAPERGPDAWVTRFSALTRGRHGLSSNPVIRGLQLLKHNVSRLALSQGARPKLIRGKDCSGIAPTQEAWYSEILLIEGAPPALPAAVIDLCTLDIFEKIIVHCCPEMKHPGKALSSDELQIFITGLPLSS